MISATLAASGGTSGPPVAVTGDTREMNDGASGDDDEDEILTINVSGMIFETRESNLKAFPTTLLGKLAWKSCRRRQEKKSTKLPYFLESRKMFFFDRNRTAFEAILYYYQTGGALLRPPTVPMMLFQEEMEFFELGEEVISKVGMDNGYVTEEEPPLPSNPIKRKIWEVFECPHTGQLAKLVGMTSVFVIILSTTVFCLETLPMFKHKAHAKSTAATPTTSSFLLDMGNGTNASTTARPFKPSDDSEPWSTIELVCIVWFAFEYLMRLFSCPNYCDFIKSFMNTIDLLAILPYIITVSIDLDETAPLSVIRAVRLVRIFRIFKLSRHSQGLRTLGYTLRASISELGMLLFFLSLGIILFSSAMFYCEDGVNDMFTSIPDAFWYSLVTMTTVGYGDKYPITWAGKMVGTMCAIVGVLTIALPVPVIVSNFEFFYKRDRVTFERKPKATTEVKIEDEDVPGVGVALVEATNGEKNPQKNGKANHLSNRSGLAKGQTHVASDEENDEMALFLRKDMNQNMAPGTATDEPETQL